MKKLLLLLCCFCLLQITKAQTGIIFTVAGDGLNGYTGDSGLATSCTFNFPCAVAVNPAGEIYISDRDNHVIRKVDVHGTIATFAGNGFPGYYGDNGQAIDAEFAAAYGLALDRAGNLYVADEAIRKIDISTGIITSIAGNGSTDPGDGGPATQAITENVHQIAFDAAGNLYITDGRHFSIRKVDTFGIITTVAGNGTQGCSGDGGAATSAQLNMPQGVAVDAAGNIFIADFMSNNIRKVDAGTHNISTICGDPAGRDGGYSGDGGPARLATLMGPDGLVFDTSGNLYINDNMNSAVRKISTTGIITTVAGHMENGGPRVDLDAVPATSDFLKGPMGITFDNRGNLYIAEADNEKVRRVTFTETAVRSVANDIALQSYPNPVSELLNVVSGSFKGAEITVSVYAITGQLIALNHTVVGNKLQFNTGDLAPGVYLLNVVTNSGAGTFRFVKE